MERVRELRAGRLLQHPRRVTGQWQDGSSQDGEGRDVPIAAQAQHQRRPLGGNAWHHPGVVLERQQAEAALAATVVGATALLAAFPLPA